MLRVTIRFVGLIYSNEKDAAMKRAKDFLIFLPFAALPYLLLVGTLTVWFDGNARTFWRSFVTILALRLLFALLDSAGGILWWRLCARRNPLSKTG
jgi:hypothetical protein